MNKTNDFRCAHQPTQLGEVCFSHNRRDVIQMNQGGL